MDSSELNRQLVSRFEEVCSYLLPNGKRHGNHWCVGGISGEPGESLQITLSGIAAGRWKDFSNADDKGGSPLWLWSKVKNCTYSEAVREAKNWMGIPEDDFGVKRHHAVEFKQPTPADRNGTEIVKGETKVMDYLILERRLDPKVVAEAKLGASKDDQWLIIPYFDKEEKEAFHIKKMRITRPNGKKEMTASAGTRRSLYGKQLIDDDVSEITITEGEIDSLSLLSVGIPAVSIPSGVSDESWIDLDWEWLARFERINLCFDMDEPGRMAGPKVAGRLGLHRCYIVSLDHKDANEALQGGFSREDFLKCLSKAKQVELDEIKVPGDYTKDVMELHKTDWDRFGWDTPWWPTVPWRVRRGELTILTGFSGHGKTPMLNQLMLHLLSQGCKAMDISLEIPPAMTLYEMTKCAMAKARLSDDEVKACVEWMNGSMLFLDCIGAVKTDRIFNAMEYARKRHGVDVIVIDSLFKCGLSSEDYGAQREFIDRLTTFCNNSRVHVILVAHTRKTSNGNEYQIPTKSDVSGSSDLVNGSWNVLVVWRNKMKYRAIDQARNAIPPNYEEIDKRTLEPDNRFLLDKQKFGGGKEAEVDIWFSSESNQFHAVKDRKMPYFLMK